jgi:23S rRNA pseudouridine2605 synthase
MCYNFNGNDGVSGLRLNKYIAACGVASRRGAEELIVAGRVQINGAVVRELSHIVNDGEEVMLDGKPIKPYPAVRLWAFHKPRGYICTNHDPDGRPTIFSILPEAIGRVVSVGRLDLDSEGLLLLTNSGEVARALELPQNNLPRTYQVRIFGMPSYAQAKSVEQGFKIDDIQYRPAEIRLPRNVGAAGGKKNNWVEITLYEGKNREVRRIFEYLGYPVNRLRRVGYGDVQLGNIELGEVRELGANALLKEMLGDDFMQKINNA